jgi:phage shock protein A
MSNPFTRWWKYTSAKMSASVDERADPRIQIQMAVEEAQRQHQMLTQQAAAVIGNQRQLEMRLSRQLNEVERLNGAARQAIMTSDQARAAGQPTEAAQWEQAAQVYASQLVEAEKSLQDLKNLHDQALSAADQARQAVKQNEVLLQQRLSERTRLLSQLEQARMQEQVSASLHQMSEFAAPSNVPSLAEVRDKIEKRYAVALGQAELARGSMSGRMLEVERAATDYAGQARLEQIRASMQPQGAAEQQPAVAPPAEAPAVEAPRPPMAPSTPVAETQSTDSQPERG